MRCTSGDESSISDHSKTFASITEDSLSTFNSNQAVLWAYKNAQYSSSVPFATFFSSPKEESFHYISPLLKPTLPYLTIPYQTIPYHINIPYHTIPYFEPNIIHTYVNRQENIQNYLEGGTLHEDKQCNAVHCIIWELYYVRDGVIMDKEMNILPIKIFVDVYDFWILNFLHCKKLKLRKS